MNSTMRVLQIGFAKSGNYWLWRTLHDTLAAAGVPDRSYIRTQAIHAVAKGWDLSFSEQADVDVIDISERGLTYRIMPMFTMPIVDIDAYLDQTTHVWSHSPWCDRTASVLRKFDKVVYILRDPRDIALSWRDYDATPFMQKHYRFGASTDLARRAGWVAGMWQQHVSAFLLPHDQPIHVILYERLLHDFDAEYRALLKYLELPIDEASIAEVRGKASFATMKATSPQHVSKGKSYRWAETMPSQLAHEMSEALEPMLRMLDYPLGPDERSNRDGSVHLPRLPRDLQRSTDHRRTLVQALAADVRASLSVEAAAAGADEPGATKIASDAQLSVAQDRVLSYALQPNPDFDAADLSVPREVLYLYYGERRVTLPAGAMSFAMALCQRQSFVAAQAQLWFGDQPAEWDDVLALLEFLAVAGILSVAPS